MSFPGGGGGKSTTTTQLSPTQEQLNALMAGQIQSGITATGGAGFFGAESPLLSTLSPEEEAVRGRATGYLQSPLLMPEEQAGIGAFGMAADPSSRLDAARIALENITGPALVNQATAAGFGRSGAINEAIARAGAGMTLPILSEAAGAQQNLGSMLLNLGPRLEERQLSRFGTEMELASLPTQLQRQEFARRQSLMSGLLGGIPFSPAPTTRTSLQRPDVKFTTDIAVPIVSSFAGGAGAGMAMGCWIADALYGKHSLKSALARYWLFVGWQGPLSSFARALYLRVGEPVSRQSLLLKILRPVFDIAVRHGARAMGVAHA